MMKLKNTIILLVIILSVSCTIKFVKKTDLRSINTKYEGVYTLKTITDIGNNKTLPMGTKVRLYFLSSNGAIKAYAYPYTEPRETSVGDNILYLLKEDFPNQRWNQEYFEQQLLKIVTPAP